MFNYLYRKCPRLKNYNYSQDGYYFITICVKKMVCYFGEVKNCTMVLNEYGKIINNCWFNLPKYYRGCVLDEFIIMPDHIHGIIKIIGADFKSARVDFKSPSTLSAIIQGFKIFSTRNIHELFYKRSDYFPVFYWQRSFYDSIIRNGSSLSRIRGYIKDNPKDWKLDNYNLFQ